MLFHISQDPNLSELIPRVPKYNNIEDFEDTTTPRVSFANSIYGCIMAKSPNVEMTAHIDNAQEYTEEIIGRHQLNQTYPEDIHDIKRFFLMTRNNIEEENMRYKYLYNEEKYPYFYVYIPTEVVPCRPAPVFDRDLTGEYWVEKPVKVQKVGGLYIIDKVLIKTVNLKIANGKKIKFNQYDYHYLTCGPDYVPIYNR